MPRQSWDSHFLDVADIVGTRGTCPRLKVGCVIVRDKQMLSTGFNGAPTTYPHCEDVGCVVEDNHCRSVVHSEINAIAQAAKHGISINGAVLYCSYIPCWECFKVILNTGISKVIYRREYKPNPKVLSHPTVEKEKCE